MPGSSEELTEGGITTKSTEEVISDSIIQIQELAENHEDLERDLSFSGYVFSVLFNCKEQNFLKLEKKGNIY